MYRIDIKSNKVKLRDNGGMYNYCSEDKILRVGHKILILTTWNFHMFFGNFKRHIFNLKAKLRSFSFKITKLRYNIHRNK